MTIYYVRQGGTAANKAAATGPGSTASACMSVAKHNSETFSAGDIIILCGDGGTLAASLIAPSNGSNGNPIKYLAEVGDTPVVDPTNAISGWTVSEDHNDAVLAMESSDLIAFWPMNESAGGTADNLEGTAARDGTYNNVTLGQTGIGDGETSVKFDGTDYLSVDTASLEAAFDGTKGSFQTWVKVTGSGSWTDNAAGYILRLYGSADDYIYISETADNSELTFVYRAGGTTKTISVAESGTGWIHVAMTWSDGDNDDEVKAYIDHVQVGSTQTGNGSWTATTFVVATIGNFWDGDTQPWLGYIAKPALWTKVLTVAQITTLHTIVASASEYYATLTSTPNHVYENSEPLTAGTERSLAIGEYAYNAVADHLYVRLSGDDDPTGHTITWTDVQTAIDGNGKQWLVFEGLKAGVPYLTDGGVGIRLDGANCIVKNCTVVGDKNEDQTAGISVGAAGCSVLDNDVSHTMYGILFYAANGFAGLAEGNTIHDLDKGLPSDADGIKITTPGSKDFTGLIIRGNDISGFQEDGIDGLAAENVLIEYNNIHDPGSLYTSDPNISGIKVGPNNTIQYNLIDDIAANSVGAGVVVSGDDTVVKRNIISDVLQWGVMALTGEDVVIEENVLVDMPICIGVGADATILASDNVMNSTTQDIDIEE